MMGTSGRLVLPQLRAEAPLSFVSSSFVVFLFQSTGEQRCFLLGSSHHVVHACLCLPCPMMRRELLAFFVAAVIFLFLSGRKTFFFL